MRFYCYIFLYLALTLVNTLLNPAHGQLGFDLKVDKPEPYEDRVLKAEKTKDKKLGGPRKFLQNLTTHYNYFFNANNKLNEVIEGAKASFREDYTQLLPFYNYTLDATAQNSKELDSVVYKAQTGIVMHDLRNDWIDNMYLLWGAAWFFEKKFDSAALMFQFINYSFAEKEKDGYYKYIGSRLDGNNALTISTKEDRKFPKTMTPPPSRNNAFIWQIRSQIELGNFAMAGSLIATLKNDPLFPKRLYDDLEEVQAYWFYKQNVWDSAATHLVNALDQAGSKQERARWEFLAAQMFELSKKTELAQEYFNKSIKHTTDPVMDIYARLNLVRINKEGGENYIDKNIEELLKMAKRDRYSDYRDVIYYMAAQMEMERNNFEAARLLLVKAAKYNNGNLASRNRSYLQIADLSFDQKKYLQAASYYDSIQTADLTEKELAKVEQRKEALKKIVASSAIISRQDSLQNIAGMPEDVRTAYISKLLKQILKSQGVDEKTISSGSSFPVSNTPDLFSGNQKGDWYFYNTTLKTQGQQKFKQTWGNRPNVDNWRRFSEVNQQAGGKIVNNTKEPGKPDEKGKEVEEGPSFAALLSNVPLSAEAMKASNDSIREALYALGMVYLNEVEDYPSAINSFEAIRLRYPSEGNTAELLFNLYYAYKKAGNEAKAEEIRKQLLAQHPTSRFATILSTGKDPDASDAGNAEATKAYEGIYDLFIEGRFSEAIAARQVADSMYKTTFWQPQLLYIQAVYHVKQRDDSAAKNVLQTLISQGPTSPLAAKAKTMIDVLNRRSQIENELAALQITRPAEDTVRSFPVVTPPPVQQDTFAVRPPIRKDSVIRQPKTDPVVINKPVTRPGIDTTTKKPIVQQPQASAYRFEPAARHNVLVVLDKVDGMFVSEVKNSFTRYNKEKYYSIPLDAGLVTLDNDRRILVISGFANAQEAIDYVVKAKKLVHLEIIPWLKPDKYLLTIVSESNLPLLLEKKDLQQYRQFLDQNLPGKF